MPLVPSTMSDRREHVLRTGEKGAFVRCWILVLGFTLVPFHGGCIILHGQGDAEMIRSRPTIGSSSRSAESAFRLGLKQYQTEHYELAAKSFHRAIQADPTHGRAHNNLGLLYFDQHRLSLAASHFDSASQFLPEDPTPLNNLGMTLEAGGRSSEAIELYRQASALDPTNPMYLGNLVRTKIRLGDEDELTRQQLQQLAMIEHRPDWVRWVQDQLSLDFNPFLDRGGSNVQMAGNTSDRKQLNSPANQPQWQDQELGLPEPVVVPSPVPDGFIDTGIPPSGIRYAPNPSDVPGPTTLLDEVPDYFESP